MNIFGEIKPLIFVGHKHVFIFALINSTRVMMAFIVVHGISYR